MTHRMAVKFVKKVSRKGGGIIFKGDADDGEQITVIVPYTLAEGVTFEREDVWMAEGTIEQHPKHGRQIHTTDIELILPSHDIIVDYLLRSPRFRNFGLGEKKIRDLWIEFGADLIGLLDQKEVDRLSAVPGVSTEVVVELVRRWSENDAEVAVRKWLRSNNVDRSIARHIIRLWGDDAIEHLERDPYELARFISGPRQRGLKWKNVDELAANLGIAGDDPRRLVGAVETALFKRLDAADTLVPHDVMLELVKDFTGLEDVAERAIVEAEKALVLVGNAEDGYQHRGIARLENSLKQRIRNMIDGETGSLLSQMGYQITGKVVDDGIRKVEQRIAAVTGKPVMLGAEQRAAIHMAVEEPFSIICGGAGTGKTTILSAVHEVLEPFNIPIYQMALSGRAAQRMKEATGRPASTIAMFCVEVKSGKRTVADDALFIIDESSMIDLSSMYRLLSYVPPGARIVMVGDPHQLPPVSFGLVFDKLVESSLVKKITLRDVHRQDEKSGIPSVARDIREYKVPAGIQRHNEVPDNLADLPGVHFIECPYGHIDSQDLKGAKEVAWHIYEALGKDADEIRVLGAIHSAKNGSWGAVDINNMLRINLHKKFIGNASWSFAFGEEVMFTKNDYDIGLNNGCLGTITDLIQGPEGWEMAVQWDDGEFRNIPENHFKRVKSAYAMTVHKAQGSQFKKIVSPIYESQNLDNSLIYTALTRGQEQVVFFGDWKVFVEAVTSSKSSDNRCVGFDMAA